MEKWLEAALDYVPRWLEFQLRLSRQPGCAIAVVHKGTLVLERAFGQADLARGAPLTPRHRFRVASHSKSFTAAGILKLREQGRLRLDDRAGQYVEGLHPEVARVTIAQLLSHSAGLVRDGADSAWWLERAPFADPARIRAELAAPPAIAPNTRFKYSNHGFALAGLVIEAVTGESYAAWIAREIVGPAGLAETRPDMPLPRGTPIARGHSGELPLGRRATLPGTARTNALAPATGFVSTAGDLARFFALLSPAAPRSILSRESRREMVRPQWRDPYSSLERSYGLGIISGRIGDWEWFGHAGAFPGYITRTNVMPAQDLAVSLLTNAIDGWAHPWLDGVTHILRGFARGGAPSRRTRDWSGRWWTLWNAVDLLPMREKVTVAAPALLNPLLDAAELAVTGRGRGRIALAGGFASHGEPARLERTAGGRATALWLGGTKLVREAQLAREMERRYGEAGVR
jgi:CubicO group peptidase (beta-lactamase class C family)